MIHISIAEGKHIHFCSKM